jgi:HD-GYP domain-containing protein (c-di-GMP phosphodiesterase class II)
VLETEPGPVLTIGARQLDTSLRAVADFVDLKSPWFRGHSDGVADLAVAAGEVAGLSGEEAVNIGRAALVHDVGQVGIPSGIWDHPGRLSAEQWERVRLHVYLSERVLRRCALLAPLADLAAAHHERVDGSGYHRGVAKDQLDLGARVLAAAEAYHAMTEDRPHRSALAETDAAAQLRAEVDAGRFGSVEVNAVLDAAGQVGRPVTTAHPAGLTDREVEVLRLIARGYANKQAAVRLGITPKTVGHHVEHIYAKAGVSTRAGATLFAMEHGLLSP